MKPNPTFSKALNLAKGFVANQSGAVAAYVAILLAVLVGFAGLAVDVGRLYTTHSQAQFAADAAAMAAATQLDGKTGAIARATIAAQTSPLVNNSQDFAQGDATVHIVRLRFLKSLPANDDLPIEAKHLTNKDSEAAYVEATTEVLTQANLFLAAVGVPTNNAAAVAVAGNTTLTCKVPPLMICNPWESASDPRTVDELNEDLRGVTLLAKSVDLGGDNNWAPGAMALLDPPPSCKTEIDGICVKWDSNTGTRTVAMALARVPVNYCFPDFPLSVRTGQANAMRTAVNVWFDMYDDPFFKDAYGDPELRPARNVTKGYITEWTTETVDNGDGTFSINDVCESTPVDDPNVAFGLPPDDCFAPEGDPLNWFNPVPCPTSEGPLGSEKRIGDGYWNIEHYWTVNHPGVDMPTEFAPTAENPRGASRYRVYRYEIENGMIPDNTASNGEYGAPICYGNGTEAWPDGIAPSDAPDRRKLSVAVINCEEWEITGNSVPSVDAEYFADMFVIRPIRGTSDYNIWLEFVDIKETGDEAVHDLVQLYR